MRWCVYPALQHERSSECRPYGLLPPAPPGVRKATGPCPRSRGARLCAAFSLVGARYPSYSSPTCSSPTWSSQSALTIDARFKADRALQEIESDVKALGDRALRFPFTLEGRGNLGGAGLKLPGPSLHARVAAFVVVRDGGDV